MAQEYDHTFQSLSEAVELVEAAFSQCDDVPSCYEAVIQQCERSLLILEKSRKPLMEIMEKSQVKTEAKFEALQRRKKGIGGLKDLVDKEKNIVMATGGCEEQDPLHQENLEQACFPAAHGGKIGSVELSQQEEELRSTVDEEDVGSIEQLQHSEVVGSNEEELLNLIISTIITNFCKRSHTHFI
ncbi:uncharacterized protein LOC132163808 [Corylus avellana]|uniref:uncharacterized protein LOC132163808 n=1 Tax=Corylus avellana TaxID=13451 RepID=UPI00286AADBE|nr:uncharacterized protein LOC132163808 [Corylus avellana]